MKQPSTLAPAGERLIVGHRPAPDDERSPSFGPLWTAANTVSELVFGHDVAGCLGFLSVAALGTACALAARHVVPSYPLAGPAVAIGAVAVTLLLGFRAARRRLVRGAGRAELTPRGVRFAKPGGDRKRIPWDYVQGYAAAPRWIQLRIGDRELPRYAIPTPTPQDREAALAYLQERRIQPLS
ncbi:MAG: hypothetical protein R3F62_25560 [Planctomycetota bacterium]